MKSLYQLSVLCVLLIDFVICRYQWACTAPDVNGQWYIPSVGDHTSTSDTPSNELYIYHVPTLNASCYGPVTAIRYCYRYSTSAGSGKPMFDWTVLILEEAGSNFMVNSTYIIQSSGSMGNANCTRSGDQVTCCDVTNIESFILPMNFIFGVTKSAQGNTHEATLLGFHETEYGVDVVLRNRGEVTLSVGSTILNRTAVPRGIRMLWFVIGPDLPTTTPELPVPTTTDSSSITDVTTDQPTSSASKTTNPTGTTDMVIQSHMISATNPESSSSIIGPAVGGAVGGLIVAAAITVVVVIALLLIKRGNRKENVQGYNNALYDANTSDTKIHLNVPNESASFSNASYAYVTEQTQREELGHDYSLPDEVHNGKIQAKHPTKESPHPAPVYATAYETPVGYGLASPYEATLSRTEMGTNYNEDIYMVPATNEDALYSQLSQIKIHSFTRDSVKLTELLGAGQFGEVHQGEWTAPGSKDKVDVAVKTLKEGASEEDKVKFLQEAAIMGQFSHPNVVKLYGVVTVGEPVMLVIEFLPKGDLRGVLCSVLSGPSSEVKIDADLPHTLLSYCRQVASGMSYLSNKLFVHRDLAARNILVSEEDVCKIADFGMSRDLADTNYYVSHGGKIPVKWTAPEAIHYKKYSTASDVWSFGCVMYEIWSLGHKPFEQYSNQDCIRLIDNGICLPPPTGCPRAIYKLMIDCWHPDSSSRPDFVSVVQQLSLPDTKLLKWSEEDKATDPEAATLGAGLDKAMDLYKDLQQKYITN